MAKMSSVLKADISDILSDANIPWEELKGGTVLITGATGLVGGLLARALSAASAEHKLSLRLIAHGRDVGKGNALAQECGLEFTCGDIRNPPLLAGIQADRLDYVFHCAAITKSADMLAKPVDVIETEVEGTKNVLELAKAKCCKSLVYLSSMEAYGQTGMGEVTERDLGYLDISSPRSSYPQSKRLSETMCVAYAAQFGLPVKIARLARSFGAGAPNDPSDMRVATQFARKALAGEDIELHRTGASIANCCYTADAVRGLLTILLKGVGGHVYNVSNPCASATIRQMAELVAEKVCGGKIKVKIKVPEDIEVRGYAPDVGYVMNVEKLKALGWVPKNGMGEMFGRMMTDWQQSS
jgi:nucleoside-diphosphate-sugar epimerase